MLGERNKRIYNPATAIIIRYLTACDLNFCIEIGIKYTEAIIKYLISLFVGLKPTPERDRMAPTLSIKKKNFSAPCSFLDSN